MKSAITWFEIPTADLAKAQAFYEAALACKLTHEDMGPSKGAVFPYDGADGVGGALLCGPSATKPGADGTLIYLDASPLLDAAVDRALAPRGMVQPSRRARLSVRFQRKPSPGQHAGPEIPDRGRQAPEQHRRKRVGRVTAEARAAPYLR